MREVLIDITRLVHRFVNKRLATGVDRVSLAYIHHYGVNARAVYRHKDGKFVFRRAESKVLFSWLLGLGKNGSPKATIYKGLLTGCLVQNVAGKFLFTTAHTGQESDNYAQMLADQKVRPIFMVHDLIPLTHPQFCRAGEDAKHLQRLHNCVRSAAGVICNSEATLAGLMRFCLEQDWKVPPTKVALLATELPVVTSGAPFLSHPYFVFVSTIEPRKNHLMLLHLWEKLALRLGAQTPKLVLIGQRGWHYDAVINLLETSPLLKGVVLEVSSCSDIEMVNYLQHSRAMLFPSFTEGFGMPVAEALTLGVPVIASDLPVFKEFSGDVPDYIDVLDEAAWSAMICDYAEPESVTRAQQLTRLKGFKAPTWKQHFVEVDKLLDQLDERSIGATERSPL